MSVFLGAESRGFACAVGETSCFLNNLAACFKNFSLTVDFVLDCSAYCLYGVKVFDFGSCAQLFSVLFRKGDVYVASERALLHLTVAYFSVL